MKIGFAILKNLKIKGEKLRLTKFYCIFTLQSETKQPFKQKK